MNQSESRKSSESARSFEQQAEGSDPGLLREFIAFLATNKKWWMTPIIAVILMLAVLLALAASPAAPFIYTLF
jgi:hypothetical protein